MGRDRYKDLMQDHSRYNDGENEYEDEEEYEDEYDEEYEEEEVEELPPNTQKKDSSIGGNRLQIPITLASGGNKNGGGGGNRLNIPMPNQKSDDKKNADVHQQKNDVKAAVTTVSSKANEVNDSAVAESSSKIGLSKNDSESQIDFSPLEEGEEFDDLQEKKESMISRLRQAVLKPFHLISFKKKKRDNEEAEEGKAEDSEESREEILSASASVQVKKPDLKNQDQKQDSPTKKDESEILSSEETGEEESDKKESFFRRKFVLPVTSLPQKIKSILPNFRKKLEDSEEEAEKDIAEALNDVPVRDWKGILKKTGIITLAASLLLTGGYASLLYYNYLKTDKNNADTQTVNNEESTSAVAASDENGSVPVPAEIDLVATSEELQEAENNAADSITSNLESNEEEIEEFAEDADPIPSDAVPVETELADVQENSEELVSEDESFPSFDSLNETLESETAEINDNVVESMESSEESLAQGAGAAAAVEEIAAASADSSFDFDSLSSSSEETLADVPTNDSPVPAEQTPSYAASLNVNLQGTSEQVQNQLNELGNQTQKAVQGLNSSLQNNAAELNASLQNSVNQGAEKLQQTAETIQNQTVSSLNAAQGQVQEVSEKVQETLTSSADSLANSRSMPLSVTLSNPSASSSGTQSASASSLGSSLSSSSSLGGTSSLGTQSSLGMSPSETRKETLGSASSLNAAAAVPNESASTLNSLAGAENPQTAVSSPAPAAAASSLAALPETNAPVSNAPAAQTPSATEVNNNVSVSAPSAAETETLSDLDGMALPPLSVSSLSHSPVRDYSEMGGSSSMNNSTGNQNGELSNLDSFQGNGLSQGSQGNAGNYAVPSNETGVFAQNNTSSVASGSYREYVTKAGDNLLTIAENELGDSTRWAEIRKLNPNKKLIGTLTSGQTILLPAE